jgi:hypothetical protein
MEPGLGNKGFTRLYKYRQDNDHTLQMLKNQELYFSFVKDFNDPFDCRIIIDCKGSDEKSWRALAEREHIPEPIKQKALEGLRSIGFDADKIKQLYDKQNFKTYIIWCLSEIRNNVLMWSHYARSHHGICVGFETVIKDDLLFIKIDDFDLKYHPNKFFHDFLLLSKVEYCDECPYPYNIFDDSRHLLTFLKIKGKDWEYEQEHRIILSHGEINKNIIRFDKSVLKEVILGHNIQDKFRKQVLELIANEYISNGYSVDVFQSSINDSRYELNIEKIEI